MNQTSPGPARANRVERPAPAYAKTLRNRSLDAGEVTDGAEDGREQKRQKGRKADGVSK